jgi:alpha-L-rhamnosidase
MSKLADPQVLDSQTQVVALKSQHPADLIGTPGVTPLLSWQVRSTRSDSVQVGYQVQVSRDPNFDSVLATDQVESNQQHEVSAPGGELASREVRFYRVRVSTAAGWSSFSPTLRIEAGLLSGEEFLGAAIGDDSKASDPATLLRKEFSTSSRPVSARLYVSARGLYEVSINGAKVGDEFLSPGWTAYDFRLNVATYDVTNLIAAGDNALGVMVGDGWHRGKFGFMDQYNNYGEKTSVILQLEIFHADGSRDVVVSDESWRASTGEVRFGDIYDGSTIDLNLTQVGWNKPGFNDSSWSQATVRELDKSVLHARNTSPVRVVERFPMKLTPQSDRVLLDAGQNISGWVELTVEGRKGQTVVIRHAEVLEAGDKLHTKALRSAKATDHYTLDRDGRHVLTPVFTFHGFRFADVVTEAEVISGVGIAISSDTPKRGHFVSSDTRLNRLHENVVWSQRDNFVGVPTDCPQRDERLGWTGDAQAFAYAANTLFDTESFWRSWLIDLALDQDDNGDVGAVIPDLLKRMPKIGDWEVQGRAGWADAATIVPWASYESFGGVEVLKNQLESMRRWANALHNRRAGKKFLPTEFQFGDWCDPDAPSAEPWKAKVSADFVANAFFARTADITSWVESLVGTEAGSKRYAEMSAELKRDLWAEMGDHAKSTTAGSAIALEFEIAPAAERAEIAKNLAAMVRRDNGAISTGFLGTPLILHALSKNGYFPEAYLMLMRREIRSWLYQVDKDATTIWERWDAIREDGSIHSGEMNTANEGQEDASMISFNHYAYGAVVDWVYRNVAGLSPVEPGYRVTRVAPRPASGFSYARASIETVYGALAIDWQLSANGDLVVELEVPFGVTAELDLPTTSGSTVVVNGVVGNGSKLAHGKHTVLVSAPAVISYR